MYYLKKYIYIFIGLISLSLFGLYFNNIKRLIIKDNNSNFMNELVSAKYEVLSSEVNYYESRTGFYAEPKTPGNYPGIIMIHEWWGLNDHIKESAKTLSSQGYRVLAVDLFGSVAATPAEAMIQTKGLDQEKALEQTLKN
jgi:carboxymethylenebutenolidase